MLVQHLETNASPFDPHWGEKEQIVSALILLMIGTPLSHNSGIPASVDNPVSCAQADDNGRMSSSMSS